MRLARRYSVTAPREGHWGRNEIEFLKDFLISYTHGWLTLADLTNE